MLKLEKLNRKVDGFALLDIDFSVDKGDYFVLIGESGSGKSMLLEVITGIIPPDSGNIVLNNKNLLNIPPQKRNIGIVYQKPTLFPHMSVFENIAYPLRIRKIRKEIIKNEVQSLAEKTEITHLLKRNIDNLSGGEIQRVTIARTLATNPDILLLDEPLSFLDVQLKKGMMSLLRKLNLNGQTILHVTHDYEEALALANKVAIIENGVIIQSGSTQEVFQRPKSAFAANFIGIKNFYKGHLLTTEENSTLKVFETSGIELFVLSDDVLGSEGYVIIPLESIIISENKIESSAVNNFKGRVKDTFRTKLGMEVIIDIGIDIAVQVSDRSLNNLHLNLGKDVWVSFKASSVSFIRN